MCAPFKLTWAKIVLFSDAFEKSEFSKFTLEMIMKSIALFLKIVFGMSEKEMLRRLILFSFSMCFRFVSFQMRLTFVCGSKPFLARMLLTIFWLNVSPILSFA